MTSRRGSARRLARRDRQLPREALGVSRCADLGEQAMRLAQLPLAVCLLANLASQRAVVPGDELLECLLILF
jgi:hypothetical protein